MQSCVARVRTDVVIICPKSKVNTFHNLVVEHELRLMLKSTLLPAVPFYFCVQLMRWKNGALCAKQSSLIQRVKPTQKMT
jgi:hypothetical protein